jgi:CheY-like chemotaxis protein
MFCRTNLYQCHRSFHRYNFGARSTGPVLAQRARPPQSIITLVARLRIDRRLGTPRGPLRVAAPASGSFALSCATDAVMQATSLAGHSVLIVEDEPMIALDIRFAFEKAGASVVAVHSLPDAIRHVEQDGLSGAVLDYGKRSQDGDALCRHLRQRNIPFILHSGYGHTSDACGGGIIIPKPAHPEVLIQALQEALCNKPCAPSPIINPIGCFLAFATVVAIA